MSVARVDGLGGPDALAVLADQVRSLLAAATPQPAPGAVLDPHAAVDVVPQADLAELHRRVRAWYATAQDALGPDGGIDAAAAAGLVGARFGDPHADDTLRLLRERWDPATVPLPSRRPPEGEGLTAATAAAWLRQTRAELAEAAGGWVLAAPVWAATGADWADLGGDRAEVADDEVDDWLAAYRDVVPGATGLLDTLALVGACGGGAHGWVVRQRHDVREPGSPAGGGWVAREHPGADSARHLAAVRLGRPQANDSCALLVVDSFTDTLPVVTDGKDPAALALGFDQPDARAPHALLLAVPPDPRRGWCLEDVHAAVEETLWWARARPLDADDLPEFRTVLA